MRLEKLIPGTHLRHDVDCSDESIAKCNISVCHGKTRKIRRGTHGGSKKSFSTKSLWSHLESYHPAEYKEAIIIRNADEAKRCKKDEENSKQQSIYILATPGSQTQQSLEETFELKKWLPDHPDQNRGNYLAEWICDSLLPYTTVENERFDVFISHLNHKFDVPSEKVLRQRIIPDIYRRVQFNIMELLHNNLGDFCSAPTDIWTSKSQHAFISFTLHFINKKGERKAVVLRCFPYDTSHTADSIAKTLRMIIFDWKLEGKLHLILRDNVLNMVNAMVINNQDNADCFLHIIHLVVMNSIFEQSGVQSMMARATKLISFFRKSPKAMGVLRGHQADYNGVPGCTLILGEKSRWSSYYATLVR
ncbi:Zinc finger BED domain-containing protein 4-like [Oopsacas minuta]|uniref:Zinc finger BED domain-containing protein 4-like n=1 Tax=Oopsacas minuta TaxID=111878 RepID=A0AAV7JMQ3_9METZ|nr:Zinc finger BED domain-containing protein 4-like [Oopsacas minuta]